LLTCTSPKPAHLSEEEILRWKMARMPALQPTLLFDPIHQKAEAAHWKMARMPALQLSD